MLDSASLCSLEHFGVLPKLAFCWKLAIERCWIEVVEAQVGDSFSPIHTKGGPRIGDSAGEFLVVVLWGFSIGIQ